MLLLLDTVKKKCRLYSAPSAAFQDLTSQMTNFCDKSGEIVTGFDMKYVYFYLQLFSFVGSWWLGYAQVLELPQDRRMLNGSDRDDNISVVKLLVRLREWVYSGLYKRADAVVPFRSCEQFQVLSGYQKHQVSLSSTTHEVSFLRGIVKYHTNRVMWGELILVIHYTVRTVQGHICLSCAMTIYLRNATVWNRFSSSRAGDVKR